MCEGTAAIGQIRGNFCSTYNTVCVTCCTQGKTHRRHSVVQLEGGVNGINRQGFAFIEGRLRTNARLIRYSSWCWAFVLRNLSRAILHLNVSIVSTWLEKVWITRPVAVHFLVGELARLTMVFEGPCNVSGGTCSRAKNAATEFANPLRLLIIVLARVCITAAERLLWRRVRVRVVPLERTRRIR